MNADKYCSKCKQWKLQSFFHKYADSKDGFCRLCIECKSSYNKSRAAHIAAQKKEYYAKNKKAINERKRIHYNERKRVDPLFKMKCNLRNRMYLFFKKSIKPEKSEILLGASFSLVKTHIESLFGSGMTWENYGQWHIDHIIPLGSAKSTKEMENLCHYSNLQPIWEVDHKIKTLFDTKNIRLIKSSTCDSTSVERDNL